MLNVKIGDKFGRLTIIGHVEKQNGKNRRVSCLCDCGNKRVVQTANLTSGHTVSCGCYHSEMTTSRNATHGQSRTKAYRTWQEMKVRCYKKDSHAYYRYGGRGIEVCERWMVFENFFEDMGKPLPGQQIDRIDNDGGYFPENCRWVYPKENSRNRSSNRLIECDGETKTIAQWAEDSGMKIGTLWARIKRDVDLKTAISKPLRTWPPKTTEMMG